MISKKFYSLNSKVIDAGTFKYYFEIDLVRFLRQVKKSIEESNGESLSINKLECLNIIDILAGKNLIR
jgi:ribosomal protein L18E